MILEILHYGVLIAGLVGLLSWTVENILRIRESHKLVKLIKRSERLDCNVSFVDKEKNDD